MPTIHQRLLNITHGVNFRELGGYQTANGQTIRWHHLIRSGSLAHLTATEQTYLAQYGVTKVIDFRSPAEIQQAPDQLTTATTYINLPVFQSDQTYSTASNDGITEQLNKAQRSGYQHMLHIYQQIIVSQDTQGAFRQFLINLLASSPNDGVLFHCTAGKDRTGIASYLLLSSLGVSPAQIRSDYLLTNQVTAAETREHLANAKLDGSSAQQLQTIQAMWSASEDYLDCAVNAIQQNYGSTAAYLQQALGFSTADQHLLKQLYLE